MGLADKIRIRTLRTKLAVAAGAGLLSAVILTALLLLVTWNSSRVVTVAQDAQARVHTFNHLLKSVRDYHGASYLAVREPGERSQASLRRAQNRFEDMIEEASQLKVTNLREREVRARIATQSRAVLDHFRDAEALVGRVDRVWREMGSQAALREVERVIEPISRLETTLEQEIRRGDLKLAQAVGRARDLNGVAVGASIVCLLLATIFLIAVQVLLQARLRPGLAQLEQGAEAIREGRLGHRIDLRGDDELATLAAAFDSMASEIARQQQQLRDVQRGLERSVEERTHELADANARLSEADRQRRAFLADVGHELRTPLTIIRGETQVALKTSDQEGFDPHETLDNILGQTDHLIRMVNDLFLIARAEAGGLPLDLRMHDLGAMAMRVAADFENLARESGGSIRAEAEEGVFAQVDAERLHRALTALIDNALKHCQPGVNILLQAHARGDRAILAVCDDGPGIGNIDGKNLFNRFHRGNTGSEGAGLGLSLVGALAEAHGGKARLDPRTTGGTRAVIELPLVTPTKAAA